MACKLSYKANLEMKKSTLVIDTLCVSYFTFIVSKKVWLGGCKSPEIRDEPFVKAGRSVNLIRCN